MTKQQQNQSTTNSESDYLKWSNKQLVQRVLDLERQLHTQIQSSTSASNEPAAPQSLAAEPSSIKKPKAPKAFDPSKYSTRFIALKFAYLGGSYNGFEHHANNRTPLPVIEEEIWKALVRCRLIYPPSLAQSGLDKSLEKLDTFEPGETPVDWEGCDYSKCGRTDRGVSAFGQVIGIRVRSARKKRIVTRSSEMNHKEETQLGQQTSLEQQAEEWDVDENDGFDPIKNEIEYIAILNRVLPPSIRILAWCPSPPPNFDARFSCKEREYRYFFTNPAFLPIPGDHNDSRCSALLNIPAMQKAASFFVGSHDFRNFCKIDASKQISEFTRTVRSVDIELVSTFEDPSFLNKTPAPFSNPHSNGKVYCISLNGSAFLWHQVRCMVAVLFLVGQGLEKPQVVKQLLDIKKCSSRPAYQIASDKPLVLWDCRFSKTAGKVSRDDVLEKPLWDRGEGVDELEWIYPGQVLPPSNLSSNGKWNRGGIMEDLWELWRGIKMDEILSAQLIDLVAKGVSQVDQKAIEERKKGVQIFQGEDSASRCRSYEPLMKRKRLEEPELLVARWAARNGIEGRKSQRVEYGNGHLAQVLGS